MYIYIYIYMYIYMYICMYIILCMYICMYVIPGSIVHMLWDAYVRASLLGGWEGGRVISIQLFAFKREKKQTVIISLAVCMKAIL